MDNGDHKSVPQSYLITSRVRLIEYVNTLSHTYPTKTETHDSISSRCLNTTVCSGIER